MQLISEKDSEDNEPSKTASPSKKLPTVDESSSYFTGSTFQAGSKDDKGSATRVAGGHAAAGHSTFPGLGSASNTRLKLYDISGLEFNDSDDEETTEDEE